MEKLKLFFKKIGIKLIVIALILFCVFKFLIGITYIRGNYMFPNIKDGDVVVTWKLNEIQRNDIVIYEINGENRVGRVIGKEGDKISFTENGLLKLNDMIVSEEVFYATTVNGNYDENYSYIVKENEYYILNDYRTGSYEDSRTYGGISENDIKGSSILLLRRREF